MSVFDEQTDFSFLNVADAKSSVASKAKKDRSVQIGDVTIGVTLTFVRTAEQKAKMSAAKKGKPGVIHTAITKAKIGAARKGHIKSADTIEKMRQVALGRKQSSTTVAKRVAKVQRPLMTPNGVFPSREAACEFYNCGTTQMWKLMNADIGFYDLSNRKKTVFTQKVGSPGKRMMTPAGEMSSLTEVTKFFNTTADTLYRWMKECPQQFYYITKD